MIKKGSAKLLLSYTLLLLSLSVSAQITISVKDANTLAPIKDLLWQTDDKSFGVSDQDGQLFINTTLDTKQTISLSHLNYQDTSIVLNAYSKDQVFYLQATPIELPLINVHQSSKKKKAISPIKLVRLALKRIKQNYSDQDKKYHAIYRERYSSKNCPVILNEAVININIAAYGQKHKHRKAWDTSWKRATPQIANRKNGFYKRLNIHFPEGVQHYASTDDYYIPLNTRISLHPAPCDFYPRFADGPLALLALDKVRLGYDFLDRSSLKNYDFTLIDTLIINNAYCYHLKFTPSNTEQAKYFGLNKTHKTGVFTGDLYLDINDLSIVHFSYTNTKNIVINATHKGAYLPAHALHTKVNYKKSARGKWELDQIYTQTPSFTEANGVAHRSLVFFNEDFSNIIKSPQHTDQVYQDQRTTLVRLSDSYDQAFWQTFAKSSYYKTANIFDSNEIPTDSVFLAPFLYDSLPAPIASTFDDSLIVSNKVLKDAYRYLETFSPTTRAYLESENSYYNTFFRVYPKLTRDLAKAFSLASLGIQSPIKNLDQTRDTVVIEIDGTAGFYHTQNDLDPILLATISPIKKDKPIVNYAWSHKASFYCTLKESRDYDRHLEIFNKHKKLSEIHFVDDFVWQSDTLYLTQNNKLLRTAKLFRWTYTNGWELIMHESDETFEFRFHNKNKDTLTLYLESLAAYDMYQLEGGEWVKKTDRSTGTDILDCHCLSTSKALKQIDSAIDFVVDCKHFQAGDLAIVSRKARQQLWFKSAQTTQWKVITHSDPFLTFDFVNTTQDILVYAAGVASFGYYTLDTISHALSPMPIQEKSRTSLSGFKDSLIWVAAQDSSLISCQLRWKTTSTPKATLFKVYAAYGNPYMHGFSEEDIVLMEAGFMIVYVHARGSGTQGTQWYEAGRGSRKLTACTDFLSVVKSFHHNHPLATTPLMAYTQSAGGPVLGYALNQAAELFTSVVFDHAFLDVVGCMSQADLPLSIYEYIEWGNPLESSILDKQLMYSPYQNIREQAYPNILCLASKYDKSTPYWQVAKFIAKIRAANTNKESQILLHTNLYGSHPGTAFGPKMDTMIDILCFLIATVQ